MQERSNFKVARNAMAALSATALLCGMVAARAISQSHADRACPESGVRWTEPVTRAGVNFAWPELALGQEAAYAFAFVRAGAPGASRGIAALQRGTEELGMPPGAIDFYDPVLAVDRAGTLHAVWGEHAAGPARNPNPSGLPRMADLTRLGRILHAERRNGRWSDARVVYRAPAISWHRALLTRLELDGGGNLHVAFITRPSSGMNMLVHLRRGPDGWRTTEWVAARPRGAGTGPVSDTMIPMSGGTYPSIAAGEGRRTYLAFASPAFPISGGSKFGGDTNSLWVRRSDDAGLTWGGPVLVHRSGNVGGYEPKVVATGGDTVHLIWRTQVDQRFGRDEIRHAISTDGGVTWASPIQVRLPGPYPVRHLRVVATTKGELYIAFGHQPANLPDSVKSKPGPVNDQIFYAHWRPFGWSVPQPLRPELHVHPFDLRIDGADRLHLLWAFQASANSPRRLQSYAVGSPCAS
ncbi:MAG TPA: sialidase family protein [Longimicrobium sp.]|jgi:hypothetical protein